MLKIAIKYYENNICVLPANPTTKRPTLSSWKQYTTERPTLKLVQQWFANGVKGLSIVCGSPSGMLETIDADNHFGDAKENMVLFKEILNDDDLWNRLIIEKTQSGGYHIIYRCEVIEGNQKLAQRLNSEGKPDVIFETRGQGGIIIAAPSPGYKLVKNSFDKIPTISIEERDRLLAVARSFHEIDPPEMVHSNDYTQNTFEDRPGDAFNRSGDIISELLDNGWSIFRQDGQKYHLSRPGVSDHPSATFNHVPNKLYVFSTSTEFPNDKALDKFATYAYLRHSGDFKAAANDLHQKGYGTATTAVKTLNAEPNTKQKKNQSAQWIENKLKELYDFRYNTIKGRLQYKEGKEWQDMSDRMIKDIWRYFQNVGQPVGLDRLKNIVESNFSPDYDPFDDYFKSLPTWDKKDRFFDLADEIIKVEPEQSAYWYEYLKKWFVAAVATALGKSVNHTCIVMIGEQSVGKTTSIEKFIVPQQLIKEYYKNGDIDPRDKDSKIAIAEKFIINLDELESASHENIGHLKSLITMAYISVRRPYGRYEDTMRRHASFIASINNEQFLLDMTGSRRFLVVNVVEVDMDAKIDQDQLWAQALHLLNDGYRYWFNQTEVRQINMRNARYQLSIAEDDYVTNYLDKPADDDNSPYVKELTSTEIIDQLSDRLKRTIKVRPNLLGKVLARNGFQRVMKRVNKQSKYVWRIKWADTMYKETQENENDIPKF